MANKQIIRSFEDLEVYQRAYKLALDIHRFSLTLPKIEQYALADQMRRGSKSVCANLAEGFTRKRSSTKDFHRFIILALGSSDEMRVWLQFCEDLGYLEAQKARSYRERYSVIARMLHGLKNKWT